MSHRLARARALILVVALGTTVAIGCSSSDDDASSDRASDDVTSTTAASADDAPAPPEREIPDGPAATLSPLEGGEGIALVAAEPPDLSGAGYVEEEHAASGTAVLYASADGDLPADGRYELVAGEEADYATRIVVRKPEDPTQFNGTVVVEWLNVSSGADAAPDFTYMADELTRGGYAWVGVSAQRIGIEGGPVLVDTPVSDLAGAGLGLKGIDPARYGELSHPGDAFAYDIFSQVGRAVRAADASGPFDGLDVTQVLAVGESQSAFALTTYVDGVQPLAGVYDGFLIHSRGAAAAPLGEPGGSIDLAGSIGGVPTVIRDDLDVPVIVVETEGDLIGIIGYLPARQPDSENVRVWEVAGSAHADKDQLGDTEELMECPAPVNRGQQSFVLRAGLRHLATWAAGGDAAPSAEPIATEGEGDAATFVLDDVGNAEGGVRTPALDAPVDVLSGVAPEGASVVCVLFGSTTPIPDAQLAELYADADAYLAAYEEATDAAVEAGFVLDDDREAILDAAQPDRIP